MPRGRRKSNLNPTEEMQAIDQKIADLQEQIADLKKQRKLVAAKADEAAKQKIVDAFVASGKTVDEFLAAVQAENAE